MTKQYNSGKNLDFDELDIPKHKFNSDNEGLYRAQEIVSPYQIEKGQYEKKFSLHQRKYYKRDKDFTPEERSTASGSTVPWTVPPGWYPACKEGYAPDRGYIRY